MDINLFDFYLPEELIAQRPSDKRDHSRLLAINKDKHTYEDKVFYDEYPVTGDTICDATVGGCGKLAYEMLPDVIDDIIELKESTIRVAMGAYKNISTNVRYSLPTVFFTAFLSPCAIYKCLLTRSSGLTPMICSLD